MARLYRKLYYLVLQELRGASRSRYIVISFIFVPLLMWGMQGGIQVLTQVAITSDSEGETLYITNEDLSFANVTLLENYSLPFDFDDKTKDTNVTSLNLGEFLVASVKNEVTKVESSSLFGMTIIDDLSYNEVLNLTQKGDVKYWLRIKSGFASNYEDLGGTIDLELQYLTSGILGPTLIQAGIAQILVQPPFTIVEKFTGLETKAIAIEGDTGSGTGFGAGFAGFIAILVAVIAPAPFVSTSFAGEREKKTMEALLALPLSRRSILFGKLTAGMGLVAVFALMNIVGMFMYNFIINEFTDMSGENSVFSLVIDLNPISIIAITITMFLSAFIAIGLGISIASLTKDVRTSESMYSTFIMIPSLIVGMLGMFGGLPESYGAAGFLIYIIPWSHSLAIFQRISRPAFYDLNTNSIFNMGVYVDLLFHIVSLVVIIGIILYVASKIFEREGIVS